MRVVLLTGHGGNDVVQLTQRPEPRLGKGDVLVDMKSVTLNRADLYMRDSGAGVRHSLPQVMGLDGSGIVRATADPDSALSPGQRVAIYTAASCGSCASCRRDEALLCSSVSYMGEQRDGTLAETIAVPAANLVPIPDVIDFIEAAALGVTYLTAWRMLHTRASLQAGETVLIFGMGGVAVAALQIALAGGARVVVISRDAHKLEQAKTLGAEHVLLSDGDVVGNVMAITEKQGVDIVIDSIGEQSWPTALRSLRRGGRMVLCGATTGGMPPAELHRIFVRQLSVIGSTLGTRAEFEALIGAVGDGAFRPVIGHRFPLHMIHDALDALEAGKAFGKIAVDIG